MQETVDPERPESLERHNSGTANSKSFAIHKNRQQSWTKFCTEIERGEEAARLNKLLSRNPNASSRTLTLPDEGYSTPDEDTLAHMMKEHFSGFIRSRKKEATSLRQPELPVAQLDPKLRLAHEIVTLSSLRCVL